MMLNGDEDKCVLYWPNVGHIFTFLMEVVLVARCYQLVIQASRKSQLVPVCYRYPLAGRINLKQSKCHDKTMNNFFSRGILLIVAIDWYVARFFLFIKWIDIVCFLSNNFLLLLMQSQIFDWFKANENGPAAVIALRYKSTTKWYVFVIAWNWGIEINNYISIPTSTLK